MPLGTEAPRYLPDLLVASLEVSQAFLVEVKFRRSFDERSARGMFAELQRQRQHWPESYAVLMISEPFLAKTSTVSPTSDLEGTAGTITFTDLAVPVSRGAQTVGSVPQRGGIGARHRNAPVCVAAASS
jgi:hypothetical protein